MQNRRFRQSATVTSCSTPSTRLQSRLKRSPDVFGYSKVGVKSASQQNPNEIFRKRLPVTRGDKVIGIVSRANVIGALVKIHREANRAATDDKLIRQRILEHVAAQDWAAGVDQAEALRALLESTPGVQRIETYLTCNGEVVART